MTIRDLFTPQEWEIIKRYRRALMSAAGKASAAKRWRKAPPGSKERQEQVEPMLKARRKGLDST